MSFAHLGIAADLENVKPVAKAVLITLAAHACEGCGLAWPGVPRMALKTGLKDTSIRAGLTELEAGGLVRIHAYPHGGRGMSTEYIVLPGLMELSTAPCGECQKRRKTPRHARGIQGNPPPRDGFGAIPIAGTPQNPSPDDTQSVKESNQSVADPRPSASGAAAPPLLDPAQPAPPRNAKDALAALDKILRGISKTGAPGPA